MGTRQLFAVAALLLLGANDAWAQRKALVIGNAAYAEGRLRNPGNDAADIERQLQAAGFTVTRRQDLDRRGMVEALEQFRDGLAADDDALVFYAGHGAQYERQSYLIPLGARLGQEGDLRFEAVPLERVLAALEPAKTGLKLVILDACRNNPYTRSFRSGSCGLARMPEAPSDTQIWYATQPNQEAQDGSGRNSPFTAQLLQALRVPGLNSDAVFRKVHDATAAATSGRQVPYPEGITKEFTFFEAASAPPSKTQDLAAVEQGLWDFIKDSSNPADFARYLDQCQQNRIPCQNGEQARKKLQGLKAAPPPPAAPNPPENAAPAIAPSAKPVAGKADFGIEMVAIRAGTFSMGCGLKDGGCNDDEKPRHPVQVRAFELGKTEVTQGQWRAVMGANPSSFSQCGDDCPVENVSWDDAQAFIKKLNALTGKTYRLPTEAEWEYACRADGAGLYCGGDDVDALAWHNSNAGGKTHPVAQKQANAWGLYDMSGNVWEWTCSAYVDHYGDGSESRCAVGDGPRVLRGGSWGSNARDLRPATRNWFAPHYRFRSRGFRPARTLSL